MKKFLTLAATAGWLAFSAGAASAQQVAPVNLGATVSSSCFINSSSDGALDIVGAAGSPTYLVASSSQGTLAQVQTYCNTSTSKLQLIAGNNTIPAGYTGTAGANPNPTVSFGYEVGTGVYSNVTVGSTLHNIGTPHTGDVAKIGAYVVPSPSGTGVLLPGTYNVQVIATLTP